MILTSKPEIPRTDEEPETNAQNGYVATPLEFETADSRFKSGGAVVARTAAFAVRGSYRAKTTNLNDSATHARFVPRAGEEPRTAKAAVRATPLELEIADSRFKSGGGNGARNWRLQIQDSGSELRKVGWFEAVISTN